jgi:hypothetical protein
MDMMIVLIIFVTLGIGADDVFVFVDAFKQSEAVPSACGTLLTRIDYTLHRSSKVRNSTANNDNTHNINSRIARRCFFERLKPST